MPIYEYRCLTCGKVFEEIVANNKVNRLPCPECKSQQTEKLISRLGGINTGKSNKHFACCGSGAECPGASACGAGYIIANKY